MLGLAPIPLRCAEKVRGGVEVAPFLDGASVQNARAEAHARRRVRDNHPHTPRPMLVATRQPVGTGQFPLATTRQQVDTEELPTTLAGGYGGRVSWQVLACDGL